ncbi:MAG: DsrE/DsrF/DrsH-like family protein [Deltaproteobacteria bacterium]|nr:DsrE/DsrF/DrsH-like family protein [Deltaproteobacteria bacterium]
MNQQKLSIIAFSGDLDKLLATFVIATGAAASGCDVSVFTTFWATPFLQSHSKPPHKKGILETLFGFLLPKSPQDLKLSRFHFLGFGTWAMKYLMKKKNIADLETLLVTAQDLGVKINVCEMSMNLMGMERSDFCESHNLNFCGVAGFIQQAENGQVIFI